MPKFRVQIKTTTVADCVLEATSLKEAREMADQIVEGELEVQLDEGSIHEEVFDVSPEPDDEEE